MNLNNNFSKQHREKSEITLLKEIYKTTRKNIFLVGDNREHIASLQQAMYDEYNVFYAFNSKEALDKIIKIPVPDVIILDVIIEPVNSLEFHKMLLENSRFKDIPVIYISARNNRQEKYECLKQGAVDYIVKPFDNLELILKIRSLFTREEIQQKRLKEKIKSILFSVKDEEFLRFEKKCEKYTISPREKDILKKIFAGLDVKETAEVLFLSVHTVKKHIRSIYKKCRVHNRVELLNCFKV